MSSLFGNAGSDPLIFRDRKSWLRTVWAALDVGDSPADDDVKTAMAWIAEELGLDPSDPEVTG